MGLYNNNAGVLTPIAGRGKAEYGASTVRTGAITASDSIAGGGVLDKTVTFSTPMPDNDYIVVLDNVAAANFNVDVRGKTTSGFSLRIINTDDIGAHTFTGLHYTAFKLYTDNEYNDLLDSQKINDASVKELITTPIQYTPNVGTKVGSICYYYKKGTRVFFSLAVQNVSSDSQLVFYQLPAGYRPYANIYTGTFQGTSAYIDTDGYVRGTSQGGNLYFNFTFDAFR